MNEHGGDTARDTEREIHLLAREPKGQRVAVCGAVEHSSKGERFDFTIDQRDTTCSRCIPGVGGSFGYLVLTLTNGRWYNDWDGEVHATVEAGRAALKEAVDAGCICFLVSAVRAPAGSRT